MIVVSLIQIIQSHHTFIPECKATFIHDRCKVKCDRGSFVNPFSMLYRCLFLTRFPNPPTMNGTNACPDNYSLIRYCLPIPHHLPIRHCLPIQLPCHHAYSAPSTLFCCSYPSPPAAHPGDVLNQKPSVRSMLLCYGHYDL